MTGTAVRPATRSDRAAVGRVLGRAFQVDPVYEWLFPDPRPPRAPATGRDLPRVAELGATLDAARPAEPHWYLFHLAADPDAQRRGIGSALLASVLPRCDTDGLGAHLECKPDNVAYYERAGFHVSGEVTVAGALTVPTMWRPPG